MATSCYAFLCFILCFSCISVSISEILYLPLTHSLSNTQFTSTHHLLKSTSSRSASRFQHQHQKRHLRNRHQVSLPLSPGSDYTLSFTLNSNPPQHVSLYLDTGSDLVWFPCKPFECILCEGKAENTTASTPPPRLSSTARSVHCKSSACSAAHSNLPTSDLCAIADCPLESIETSDCHSFSCPSFYYAYGDGSLVARLYHDSIKLPLATPSLSLHNFTFGCAHTALAEPVGVAGFGRGVLSLPAQLASFAPQLGNRFSYCLVSHSFNSDRLRLPSPLILGHSDDKEKRVNKDDVQFVYTSMLDNPKHPYFYCVGLEGISIGKKKIPAPEFLKRVDREGSGGVVVDSGTTFTMLPASLYNSVVAEFDNRVGRVYERAKEVEDKTGLGPCYYYDTVVNIPSLVLHFVGNESSVVLPKKNYFYDFLDGGDGVRRKRRVGCLMLMNGGEEAELTGGPGATLGNYQQHGFEVVYDLEQRRVGFARRKCASLWESLNQG
ncbi:probable aspartyl protease At4g16563 [Ricinus communis]|uniref:Pepsin A, putative n=1 Tax=Ricinus communis TaxID=3988 RepID=B9SSF8_RICCO|nr:probable aspartyl protease At4g16563 [Ricinus communis]EEF33456.1 pepsin A, putative [Ricinus communis]|eukprot:XP_002528927.1 probable aspartyl protease At4g16563 [Ricinus communis]